MSNLNDSIEKMTEADWEKIYVYVVHDGEVAITAYKGNDIDVIIPEKIGKNKVTKISMYAFSPEGDAAKKNSKIRFLENKLKSVVIPKTVKTIDQFAFLGCKALENVTIPEGVNKILFQAFMDCTALTDISIPGTAAYIDSLVFYNCEKLVNVSIANGIESIEPEAFAYCKNLGEINIPESVTEIGEEAFADCRSLSDIYIPKSVTTFGGSIFSGCKSRVTIHTESGSEAEKYAKANKIKYSTNRAVNESWKNGKIEILSSPEVAQQIWSSLGGTEERKAFSILYLRSGLKKNVDEISNYIQRQKDAIAAMCIENQDAEGLHLLLSYIPKAELDWIDKYIKLCSDKGASLLTTFLNYKQQNYSADDIENAEADKFEKEMGFKERTVEEWKKIYKYTVVDDEITILFYKGEDKNVVIPDFIGKNKVTVIGKYAFSPYRSPLGDQLRDFYINELSSVVIPSTVIAIEDNAFCGCEKLSSIIVGDNVKKFGNNAFDGCQSLTSIMIPDSVSKIGEYAFWCCESLTDITIPDGVTEIRENVFRDCKNLTNVTLPKTLVSIGDNAFDHCENLENITITDGVTEIGEEAFAACRKLASITIPKTVTKMETMAFYGCESLADITIYNGITKIDDDVFGECSSLTSITIPDSVKKIGGGAFSDCSSLKSVTIPSSVTEIDDWAFSDCAEELTIYTSSGSKAEKYAKENDIKCEIK